MASAPVIFAAVFILIFLGMGIVETFDAPHEAFAVLKAGSKHLKYDSDANDDGHHHHCIKKLTVVADISPSFTLFIPTLPHPTLHQEIKPSTFVFTSNLPARASPVV